jgi:hypothetical protein
MRPHNQPRAPFDSLSRSTALTPRGHSGESSKSSSRSLQDLMPDFVAHDRGSVRRIFRWVLAFALCGALASACGLPGPSPVTYTAYQLTCCTRADIEQVWAPGTSVDLHWIVQTSSRTTINPTHKVVITAVLQGPFSDVTTLKRSGAATHAVQGSALTFDDRTLPSAEQVTTFSLPPDLPAGYYNLNMRWDLGDGSSVAGSSVVRVATQPNS